MDNLFLTGMGRSGTTLLEKLLTNHDKILILSQPFPTFFTELKKYFLNTLGIDEYYVLNNGPNDNKYDLNDFIYFLDSYNVSSTEITEIFKKMINYSGQITKPNYNFCNINHTKFIDIYNELLILIDTNKSLSYLGSKEILCEEYVPYFLHHGKKAIIIIRDPRDVLASANYPKGKRYLGNKKPTLFLLKSWRKSVEFCFYLKDHKNFHFLRYEDLVKDPYRELKKITSFLNLHEFKIDQFNNGIYDQDGNLWSANTSFDNTDTFISTKSVGVYKNILSMDEITYTETVCKHEMNWLGYNININRSNTMIIEHFVDTNIQDLEHLSGNYTSQAKNKLLEINRYEKYKKFYT